MFLLKLRRHGNVSFKAHAEGDIRVGPNQHKRQDGPGSEDVSASFPANSIFTIFNEELTCSGNDGSMVHGLLGGEVVLKSATITATVKVDVEGTVVPPNIASLSFSARAYSTLFERLFLYTD